MATTPVKTVFTWLGELRLSWSVFAYTMYRETGATIRKPMSSSHEAGGLRKYHAFKCQIFVKMAIPPCEFTITWLHNRLVWLSSFRYRWTLGDSNAPSSCSRVIGIFLSVEYQPNILEWRRPSLTEGRQSTRILWTTFKQLEGKA